MDVVPSHVCHGHTNVMMYLKMLTVVRRDITHHTHSSLPVYLLYPSVSCSVVYEENAPVKKRHILKKKTIQNLEKKAA